MAQTGFTPISLYYTTTAAAVPTAGNLVAGELAINTQDGKLFYKDSSGVVQTIASKAGNSGSFTNLAYTGTLTGGTGVINLGSGQFYKDASGNVGLGISSPVTRLDVSGPANVTSFTGTTRLGVTVRGSTGATDYSGIDLIGNSQTQPLARIAVLSTGGGSNLQFGTSNSYASGITNTAMTIDPSGNVGIGTSSPAKKLTVNTAGVAGAMIRLTDGTQQSFDIESDVGAGGAGVISYNTVNGGQQAFKIAGTERMRIDSSGNVIVSGTSTSSDEATYQSGGVFVSRRASSAGTTHANFLNGGSVVGSITSNTVNTFYNVTSDYRLKENATPVTTGLQTVTALNPVNFDWISKNVSDTGFLAHEFQAVIPNSVMGTKDAVDANGNPIYQQIDRSGAIPFLVAAIKEQQAIIENLTTRLTVLENK